MTKVRKTALLKALAREWGEWKINEVTPEMRDRFPHLRHCAAIWSNNRYEVQGFKCETAIGGVWQIGVIRHGDIEQITWSELQRIVHERFGDEVTAIEVYPPREHEWNTQHNLRVLWILPSTWPLPFGLHLPGAWGQTV
jgi:hypothetical protein